MNSVMERRLAAVEPSSSWARSKVDAVMALAKAGADAAGRGVKSIGGKIGLVTLAVAPVVSFAQSLSAATTFDPTSYVTSITGVVAGILAIGGAVFGVYVAIKSTKWATRSL
ncbi:MAG: major capsid protein [Rhodoferax sp.]|nr:major capsid protein [Rhodoferax sp.]